MNKITNIGIESLPNSLKNYENIAELARLAAEKLNEVSENAQIFDYIWARIDELPENLLDTLAYDLHIDWYDYGYSIEQKREVIKTSVKVHKKLGTKYAVETALKAAYPNSRVTAWHEEGGSGVPYSFDVVLDTSESETAVDFSRVNKIVYCYKSLRDRLNTTKFKCKTSMDVYTGLLFSARKRENVAPAARDTSTVLGVRTYAGAAFIAKAKMAIRCEIITPAPTPAPGNDYYISGVLKFGGIADNGVKGVARYYE